LWSGKLETVDLPGFSLLSQIQEIHESGNKMAGSAKWHGYCITYMEGDDQ